jgi:hypothetical protein
MNYSNNGPRLLIVGILLGTIILWYLLFLVIQA